MEENIEKRLAAGVNPVTELLRSGNPIDRIFVAKNKTSPQIGRLVSKAKNLGIPVIFAESEQLNRLCGDVNHQGVIAVCAEKEYCSPHDILEYANSRGEPPFIIILDGLNDPHNFGAIIRSADAAGAHGIIVAKRGNAPLSQVVSKTSAGALEYAHIARVSNLASTLDKLKKEGLWIFGTSDKAQTVYTETDLNLPLALIIGDEGDGIGRLLREKCDFLVKIPMQGNVSSLNASVAAGILMFETQRQRKTK